MTTFDSPTANCPETPAEPGPVAGGAGGRCPVIHGAVPAAATSRDGGAPALETRRGWVPRDLHRWTLAGVGVLSTALAILGAILPGLPTTIFVIIAAWCFARSCPVLEQKLLRNRLLAPSMQVIDGTRPFTASARFAAIGFMAGGGAASTGILAWRGTLTEPLLWTIVAAMIVGAVAILLYKPTPRTGG